MYECDGYKMDRTFRHGRRSRMTWRYIPRKGVNHLHRNPLTVGFANHTNRDQAPARMTQDHRAIEQLEGDLANDEQIRRSGASGLTAQEVFQPWRVVGGFGPYTCRRLIQQLRSRASTIRHGSVVRSIAGSRGSCVVSGSESRKQSVHGRRHDGTSRASRCGNPIGANGSWSSAER